MNTKYLVLLIVLFKIPASLFAQTNYRLSIAPYYGYQKLNFHWSISGNSKGESPNVLSELKWKNISGPSAGGSLKWNVWNNIRFFAAFSRTSFTSGKVNDQDYSGNDRIGAIYNESFDADKGSNVSYQAGLEYRVFKKGRWNIDPAAGYISNEQNFHLLDRSGIFPDLHSTYSAEWKGAYIRLNTAFRLHQLISVEPSVQYSQFNYNAWGNWNLISSFQHPVSYRHHAHGYGIDTELRLRYLLSDNIALQAGAAYFNWQTGKGTDVLYLSSGELRRTQMNGSYLNGFQLNGALTLSF